jgi:hypothetical protein
MAKVILHSKLRAFTVDSASAITLQNTQPRVQYYFASDYLFIIYVAKNSRIRLNTNNKTAVLHDRSISINQYFSVQEEYV